LKCNEKAPWQTHFFIEDYTISGADDRRIMKPQNAFMGTAQQQSVNYKKYTNHITRKYRIKQIKKIHQQAD